MCRISAHAAERRILQAEATALCFTAHVAANKLLKLVLAATDLDVVAGPPRAMRWCSVDRAATCSMEPQISRGPIGVQHEQVRMIRQPLEVAAVIVGEGLHFAMMHHDAWPNARSCRRQHISPTEVSLAAGSRTRTRSGCAHRSVVHRLAAECLTVADDARTVRAAWRHSHGTRPQESKPIQPTAGRPDVWPPACRQGQPSSGQVEG